MIEPLKREGEGGTPWLQSQKLLSRVERLPDALSGTPRAHAIDRWIFVFMAAWFIAIVLAGFIPDSMMKVGMVQAGARPPFPIVLHMHAVLMGSFLLLLLTQTVLMATGGARCTCGWGSLGMVAGRALVAVGFVLAPTMYYQTWNALQSAPPARAGEAAGGALDQGEHPAAAVADRDPVPAVPGDRHKSERRECRAAQTDDDPGDGDGAAGRDRPDSVAADDDAGEPAVESTFTRYWRFRRCWFGT